MTSRPIDAPPVEEPPRLGWRSRLLPPLDDMDDDSGEEPDSPLVRDGTPPPQPMDVNMVFTLPAEFKANSDTLEEAIAQLCLGLKATTFKKPKDYKSRLFESSVGKITKVL